MVSPTRRREALAEVRRMHPEYSQRRACKLVGLSRNAMQEPVTRLDKDKPLVSALVRLAQERPRSGYRMLHGLVRDAGFKVGRDRVYRLCRRHGLRVPVHRRLRRAMGTGSNAVHIRRAQHANHVWTWDFVSDQTMNDGRSFKVLTVVDEFTRRPLLTFVARRINSRAVIRQLMKLFEVYGVPEHIRSDNGPEFVAKAVRAFLDGHQVKTLYIEPGSPWQNGIIESFNGRLKDECMNIEAFMSLEEARVLIEDYRRWYMHRRPHSSLNYMNPAAFMAGIQQAQDKSTAAATPRQAGIEREDALLPSQTLPSSPTPAEETFKDQSFGIQSHALIHAGS